MKKIVCIYFRSSIALVLISATVWGSPQFLSAQSQLVIDSLMVVYQQSTQVEEKADVLLQLCRSYWKSDVEQSKAYANQALETLEEQNMQRLHCTAYRYLGNSYLFAANYEEAVKQMFNGLKIAQEINDNFEQFAISVSIAGVYDRLEKFEEAKEFLFKALAAYNNGKGTADEDRLNQGAVSLYNNLGNIYQSQNEPEKATEYYTKGLELARQHNNLYTLGSIANNLGKIHLYKGNFDEALAYLQQSEQARLKINDELGLSKTYYFLAEFYLMNGAYHESITYAEKSLHLGQKVGALLSQHTAAELLTNAYDSLGDYSNAFAYHKLLKEVSDTIFNEKTISEVTRLKFLHEQAIIDNQLLKEKQQTKLRNTVLMALLSVGIIILTALLVIARNRQKRVLLEKKEFEGRVHHKKKELATSVLYLLRKNETMEAVTKKLLELKKMVTKENRDKIQHILQDLQAEIDTNAWKEFELRFQDVHQGFYDTLQQRYPELTPSERKLAAFLKLNMSTKEIAVITGQSIRSLEVARYRLRKKLNITNKDVNLTNFLGDL